MATTGQRNTRRSVGGDYSLQTLVARNAKQDSRVIRIILDDQQQRLTGSDVVAVVLDVLLADGRQYGDVARSGQGGCGAIELLNHSAFRRGVAKRQIEREDATLPPHASELDLTAEQQCQFATDRETKAGAAIFSRCSGVGLLEGLENQLLLLRRNAGAGILDGESDHVLRLAEHGMIDTPAFRRQIDPQFDVALSRELDGVRQKILQDLLKTL